MSKFSEYIGSQFGNPHGIIGKICCLIMNKINKKMYKKVVSTIGVDNNSMVLDIGYGNGYLLKNIYKKYKCNMYGIDISNDMKKLALKKNKKAYKDNKISLEVGDCCNLQYDDLTFDSITSINTVYFWSDIEKGLNEIKRVLKPGKAFYNVLYTKEWLDKLSYTKKGFKKIEAEELVSLGLKLGFSNVRAVEIVKNKSFMIEYIK